MIQRSLLCLLPVLMIVLCLLAFLNVPSAIASPVNIDTYVNPERQRETSIAVNPNNPDNIIIGFNDYTSGGCQPSYVYTINGGTNWTYGGSLPRGALAGNPYCDPWLAFDDDGYLYYVALSYASWSYGNQIFVCVGRPDASENVGPLGFGNPQIVDDGSVGENDKPVIAVDRTGGTYYGNVYVAWSRRTGTGGYKIWFRRGTRTGPTTITWTEDGFQVSPADVLYTQGAQVAVGPKGEVYVAHARMKSRSIPDEDALLFSRSLNGGAPGTWTTGVVVSSVTSVNWFVSNTDRGVRHSSFPTLGVSPTTGTIFVAWADRRYGDDDILLSKSTDEGDTWTLPILVNDDQDTDHPNGKDQFHPALTVTGAGNVEVIFYDKRDDPANKLVNLYHAKSTDDGNSFLPNVIITSAATDPDVFAWSEGGLGDYIGIDSMRTVIGTTFICWTDGRVGNTHPQDYNTDIFFDKIVTYVPMITIQLIPDRIRLKVRPFYVSELPICLLSIHGFDDRVWLDFSGVPGADGVFEPSSGIPPFDTTLYLNTMATKEGTYELNIIAYTEKFAYQEVMATFPVTLVVTMDPFILLNTTTTNPGAQIALEAYGFTADSSFYVFFDDELLETGKTDSIGGLSTVIMIPSDTPDGTHTVLVKDETGTEASASLDTPILDEETKTGAPPDDIPPSIGIPSREPAGDVMPDQEVTVSVNVTDAVSGVKNVILSYTIDDGASWTDLPMTYNSASGLYQATISGQAYCTWVKYKIIAYDNAENPAVEDNAGQYYVYHVIPEFPSGIILALFMTLTLITAILAKRKKGNRVEHFHFR